MAPSCLTHCWCGPLVRFFSTLWGWIDVPTCCKCHELKRA